MHFIGYNVIFSGCFIVFLFLISVLFLAGFLMFLNIKSRSINQEIVTEQSKIIQTNTVKGIEKRVEELNNKLLNLEKTNKNQSNFYQTLFDIIPELLSKVNVYTLEMNQKTKTITVIGFSSTRENLLEIKHRLENSPKYKEVNFPMSNLTNAKNIDFRFDFIYE